MDRRFFIGASALALVAGGSYWMSQSKPQSDLLPGAANAQEATGPIEIQDIVLGSADAPVEIIEYASFTCPHCANFHANQFKDLQREYIDTGKVRFIFREVYFDRPGLWASMVARCGGEMRFHGIVELLMEKQGEWARAESAAAIVEELRTIGKTAGLTDDALDACMQDAGMAQSLVNWYEDNAARDQVTSTPTLFINGEKHPNMSFSDMAVIIDGLIDA